MKKTGLKVCSAAFALCMAFGVGNVISASANEPVYVENNVAVNGFYVVDGAAVHLGETTTGIRYGTIVTDAFKTYLSTTYADATFEWHTLITGVNMLEGGDVTKVTPDLKKPDWVGNNAGQNACKDFTPALSALEDDEEKGTVADVDKDGKTDEIYYAAITYQNLTNEQKATASNADLIARSYVKITQGETETIIYSAAEDTVRNMKAVAYAAIKSGKFTANESVLYGYTGVTANDVVENDTVNSFYSLNDEKGAITIDGMNATSCEVYYGARKLSATLENDVVTVSGLDALEAGEDLEYELTVFAGGKIYDQAFGCATQVIDEASDLEIFNMNITDYAGMSGITGNDNDAKKKNIMTKYGTTTEGYYVLTNNVDASTYAMNTQGFISATCYYQPTHGTAPCDYSKYGFRGTFDGRGYTISGLTLGNKGQVFDAAYRSISGTNSGWNNNTYSLFGIIGDGGVVKNMALTDVKFDLNYEASTSKINSALCSPMATWITKGATVENVFVSLKGITRYARDYTVMTAFAYGVDVDATLKNIVVDDTYVVTESDDVVATPDIKYRGSFEYRQKVATTDSASTTEKWTNVTVLSERTLTCYSSDGCDASNITDVATGYAIMPGTYRYGSVGAWETAQADANVTTKPNVGDFGPTYWHLVNGVPVWGKAAE